MFTIKKIVIVSHCVLNQHSVILGDKRANGSFLFASTLIENEVGIIQMQCPELLFGGYTRESKSYKDYDT